MLSASSSHGVQQYRPGPVDDGLRIAALKLLHVSGYTPLRRLRCEVTEAVVIVTGVVPSYYLKQMAQTIMQRLEGVQSVMNLVEVREADSCSYGGNENDASEAGPYHF